MPLSANVIIVFIWARSKLLCLHVSPIISDPSNLPSRLVAAHFNSSGHHAKITGILATSDNSDKYRHSAYPLSNASFPNFRLFFLMTVRFVLTG